jgi:ATP synthase protein I
MTERQSPPSPDSSNRQGPTLEDLDARLRKARGIEASREGHDGAGGGLQSGMSGVGAMLRIGIEMVSAVAVGFGIGWLLDSWLGTKPWLMILFFFMGSAAGILGVFRATGRIAYGPGAVTRDKTSKQDAEPSARNDRE